MLSITARITHILERLGAAVAIFVARQVRGPLVVGMGTGLYVEKIAPSPYRAIPGETWRLLVHRVGRLSVRFRRLVARWRAGTLPPPRRPSARRVREGQGAAPMLRADAPRLPRERGWINKRIAGTAPCAGHLQALLHDEDLARFLAEVPRAGRLLRPLCHALGLDLPDALNLSARPRPPRRRPPAPVPPDGTPVRPLPAYVATAGRAWKKRGC